jgi:hypothetical protein
VPGTTLVAVVALGRGGQVIGVVNGNVTGQSDQPWTLGTSGGSAGSGYITSSSSATAVPVQPATANSTATTVGH